MSPAENIQRRPRVAALLDGVAGIDWNGDAPPLANKEPMDLVRFLDLAEQMACLVARVHARGVTHGDLHPENFRQRDIEILLTGFGHAMTFESDHSGFAPLDRLPSDVAYLAPEQTGRMNRPVDHRADLYALGGTFYRLATGRPPFADRERSALIHAHLAKEPLVPGELAPWLPPALSQIILRLLAKEPDERYQSASGLAEDLAQLRAAAERGKPLDQVSLRAAGRVLLPRAPRRRHGRDHALGELRAAFDAVTRGGSECLFLAGEAGVGKTSLVNELQRPVALRGGRFVRGKCEQFQRDRPLLAPVQALRQLLTLLAGESEEVLRELRPRLPAGLGPDAGALVELLPELPLLAGELPPAASLDPREAQRRLTELLVRLVGLVASPSRPLVLVLDDLQWADQPTLEFITALLEDDDLDGVLLAGLFRRDELEHAPALRHVMEARPSAVLHLENLPPREMSSLVGEMLGVPAEEVGALAGEVHRATQGNPFHAIELVQSLHREGTLFFDAAAGRWTWDAAALAIHPPSTNVVELLTGSLSDFPPATADALVVAACLGADLTLDLLALATDHTREDTVAALLPALERGVLVTPDAEEFTRGRGPARVAFCHDRMQQAAASLRDEAWCLRRHLEMARRFADASTDPAVRARAAGHYAEACALLEDAEEKEKVAALFLEAGRYARMAGSFAAAHRFVRLALDLLAPDPWSYAPALARDLHEELHVVCYCLPDYPAADAAYAALSAHAPGPGRLANAAAIQVMSLSNRTRYEEAVRLGAALLEQLGIRVPLENPEEPFEKELGELYRAIESGALERLPTGGDAGAEDHAAAKLLNRMVPAAFFFRPSVANWLVVHAARVWAEGHYDNARLYPMACLALATIPARGDHATGYRAARAALMVGENTERGVETARARHVFGLFNCHWLEPLEHGLAQAHQAHDTLLRSGELEFACYTFFTSQAALLETATTLADLEAENRRALDFAGKTGNRHATESYTAFRGLIASLSADFAMEADEIPASNPMAACFHHTTRALAACLFGEDVTHAQHAEAAVRLAPYITGFYPTALINVLESLALLTRHRSGDRDPALAERVAANQDWLAARAAEAPANFGHLHDLVEAERLAAAGRGIEALPVYERAIRRAKAHQRPWHTALAVEKAARCYLTLDLEHAGHRLLEQACTLYAEWGATRKSAALAAEFPFLQATPSGFRDAQPLFAAIQQLASLRSVPQLAAATAEILQKLSGATDGQILALDEQDQWMLKAGFSADGPLDRQTLEEAEKAAVVPATVVRLGLRLQHAVLSDDAVHDTRFAGDPRFRDLDRCAVLGVPVISRNRAVAFLVLENRRLRGAFTKDLAETIGMLCGQLAVSIENARLYRSLENKVEQRTRELRLVLDNIPIAVVATTLTSPAETTFINQHFIRIFGYTLEDIPTVAAWAEKAYPDAGYRREVFLEWDAAVFRAIEDKGRVESMEFQVTGKDGTKREIIFGAVVLEDRLLVSMTDVSERKKAERAIRSLREELQKTAYELTENIPVGTYTMVQPPGGGMASFSFMSTRFLELTGLERSAAEADPLTAFACVHPDDYDEWVRKNAYVFEHKLPFKEETRVVVKGETRWIVAESTPRDAPDGSVVWEGVLQDITERKLAEAALRQVTQRMQLAAAAAGIGFWSRDNESRIEEWDDQMFRIYGVSREDFDGRWEPLVHPDDLPVVERLTEEALTAGRTGEYEYRIVRPDGTARHIRGMSVCASGPLGESSREIGVNFDITEEKEAARREKEFDLRYRRELESKLKTSLTASAVAHEINQPLSSILLQSKMALQTGEEPAEALRIIAQEAQRVVVTIEKMKTLLRNVQTEQRPVDLVDVVRSALLYNKGLLARHGVNLQTGGLEHPCRIIGDDAQLQLAITNLLRNAAEAIDDAEAEKREIALELCADGDTVELLIGDSGPGWSGAEDHELPLTTTKKGGTGIGLYVVRTAMENHRGEIVFGQSPLGGAEVRLKFPRLEEKA